MRINNEINLYIKNMLMEKLVKSINVPIMNGSTKKNEFIPYTEHKKDNVFCDFSTGIISQYNKRDVEVNLRALSSSSVLTYNTFCRISENEKLVIQDNEYYKFTPEKSRKIIDQRGAISRIDAELLSKNKTILVETKLFEPYEKDVKSSLKSIESYLEHQNYPSDVFTSTEIDNWINLFKFFAEEVDTRRVTQFDILQFLKHLLSIATNKNSFKTREVELMSLIWHASYSFVGFWKYADEVRKYDGKTLHQTEYCIDKINEFLVENNYDWISVSTYDYVEFIWTTNIYKNKKHFRYLSRYFDTVDISTQLIFDIEMDPMITTIYNATNSHFVKSYCIKMREQKYPEDMYGIKLLLPRLLTWYDEGFLKKLLVDTYTLNIREHLYTYLLLNTLIKELEIEYLRPKKVIKVPKLEFFSF